jgi:hypothetical protein
MHSSSGSHNHSKSSGSHSTSGHRNKHGHGHGHIERGAQAEDEFMQSHPCPSTGKASRSCPGYVIGRGGDDPSNLQWQATQAAM